MEKKVNKIKQGDNGTAFVDTNITVIVSVQDEIEKLNKEGDYMGMADLLIKLKSNIGKQHPYYPHYRYKTVDIGGKIMLEHEPSSKEAAVKYPLTYKGKFNIQKKQLEGFSNLDDLLNDAFVKQKDIKIDMVSLSALIAGEEVQTPFIDETLSGLEWVIQPRPLPNPLKLKLSAVIDSKEITILDYIELTISDINKKENIYTLDNRFQRGNALLVSVVIPFRKQEEVIEENVIIKDLKINFKVKEEYQHSVKAILYQLDTLIALSNLDSNADLVFKNLETNLNFVSGFGFGFKLNEEYNLEEERSIFKRLREIEKYFNITFTLPEEFELETIWNDIIILESMINHTSIKGNYMSLTWSINEKEFLKALISGFEKEENNGSNIMITSSGSDLRIELFEAVIPIDKVQTVYNSIKFEDIEKAKRKYQDMEEGETIKLKLVPAVSDTMEERYFPEK